jgi:aminoglycoside phosphotransferase family enzyme
MCREEVRLNRRLAPDVYLGVCSVAASDGGLELAAKLGRGELTRGEVVALGRVLASFHARARSVATRGVPALIVERRMTEKLP